MDKEIISEIGKKWFLADDNTFAAKLIYLKGIDRFDAELNDKYQNELGYVIHFTQYPKGILIKLAKNFSAISFGLGYEKISAMKLLSMTDYSYLIIKTEENDLFFGITNDNISDLKEFIKSTKLDLKTDNSSKVELDVDEKFRKYLLKYTDVLKIDTSKIASPKWKRFVNFLIDYIIISFVSFWIGFSSPETFSKPIAPYFISIILIISYYLFFEGAFRTTIGKIITNSRVVSSDGTRADGTRIFERTLSRLIPFEPLSFLSKDKSGWHDNLSKTIVIDNDKRKTVANTQ